MIDLLPGPFSYSLDEYDRWRQVLARAAGYDILDLWAHPVRSDDPLVAFLIEGSRYVFGDPSALMRRIAEISRAVPDGKDQRMIAEFLDCCVDANRTGMSPEFL